MSRKNKLQKFAELLSFPNVYENYTAPETQLVGEDGEKVDLRGNWGRGHFGNSRPITLELACGRGEYTLGLSRLYPGRNFIGVDVKGARIWKGARAALDDELHNAAFLRCRIEMIDQFFAAGEVDSIWIIFPDPFLRRSKANRRLTSPAFLRRYSAILKPGASINLKTDDSQLFEYTLEVINAFPGAELQYQNDDIYAGEAPAPELELKTYYERQHLAEGKTIKYVRFSLG